MRGRPFLGPYLTPTRQIDLTKLDHPNPATQCPGSRVVNVTSMAGLMHGQPCMSAYCATKHAAEAFSTALRLELRGWGIKVVTINPSFHRTPIATNGSATLQRAYDNLSPEMQAAYGPRCVHLLIRVVRLVDQHDHHR